LPRVPVILGPTAVGKTAVAVEIAQQCGGEIVSCDSRQVFKYLDIGTAKPTAEERRRVRFHLVDIIPPDRFMNAHEFRGIAEEAIDGILSRGKVPIMTVGTGFYFKVMTDGILEAPPADEDFRSAMEEVARAEGLDALYARLSEIDPEAASRIAASDKLRMIRALELYHLTGKTRTELSGATQLPPSPYQFVSVQLALRRSELYRRIDGRCESMVADGLVDEAKLLRDRGLLSNEMASKIVGYKEAFEYLDGRCSLDEMLSMFQQATRNYAKRQLTWFRAHTFARKFDARDKMLVDNILRDFSDIFRC
jgi:tRNA dimethylallyltransferase